MGKGSHLYDEDDFYDYDDDDYDEEVVKKPSVVQPKVRS